MHSRVSAQTVSLSNLLQIDFNLFGMGFLRLDEALFRSPIPDSNWPRRPGWREAESIVHHETSSSGQYRPLVYLFAVRLIQRIYKLAG